MLFAGGAAVLYDSLGRVQQRVTVWLEPWTDEKVYCSLNGALEYRQNCDSYQLVKSLYSIANGGYGGTGIGNGTFQTVDGTQLIPYLQTDFIYSAIAQELGLIGAAAVLLLFLALVARDAGRAVAHDGFSKLLAAASRSASRCRRSSSSAASSASCRSRASRSRSSRTGARASSRTS